MPIRKPKLIRSLVGRKLTKPKFLRFPSLKHMLLKSLTNKQAQQFVKRGGIQRLARQIHTRPNVPITATLLPTPYHTMPKPVLAQLVQTTNMAMRIPLNKTRAKLIPGDIANFPPISEFTGWDNYISDQGGRVGIGVEIGIFNPQTDQIKDIWHTFIFDGLPNEDALEQTIEAFVQDVCDSPAFQYLKDGDGYCNYLYNLVVVDYVN